MAIGTIISLFTGAMGLDLGFEDAGFDIRVAVECNKWAAGTIRMNRPDIEVIERDIESVTTTELLESAGLEVGQCSVVTGGPSCQSFSTAGRRNSLSDPRGGLFHHFLRIINEARPRFFVMENVKGILSAAIKHRPLNQRGPGHPPLSPEEELGSALKLMLEAFARTGYYVIFDLLNAADYGTPQTRQRVIFIGSRDGEHIKMPLPTHDRHGANGKKKWVTLREALDEIVDPEAEFNTLSKTQIDFLKYIPAGGNWRDLPEDLQEKAIGGAFHSWGGRGGFFRRLSWDEPSAALTTSPSSKATMLCHPEISRPLSIREYSKLQQFPDSWEFEGSLAQRYIQIGNAVPVSLSQAIAAVIIDTMVLEDGRMPELLGKAYCASADLAKRLACRPKTTLNPPHMRPGDTKQATKQWLQNLSNSPRTSIPVAPIQETPVEVCV